MEYRVILEPDPKAGGYVVSCSSLPGCDSQGEAREKGLAKIRDAVKSYLRILKIESN
jgi:predicted RNase H-like HicB family nuclease